MRILIVHYNPQAPGVAGGAESAIRDQQAALRALGHTVETCFTAPDRMARQFGPDIIHFHTIHVGGMGMTPLVWAQRAGIPCCLSLHDYWPFCEGRMLLARYDESCAAVTGDCDERCSSKRMDARVTALVNEVPTIAFNLYSALILRRHGVRVDVIIPHGIDTDYFHPKPEVREPGRIVMVSAWPNYPTKGAHVLRKALSQLNVKGNLVSGVTRERVRDELQRADILVFPSCYEETWGLCLTEGMASGCACVASNVCGPRAQIQNGETGLLFENRNAEELAACLHRLLTSPAEARRLGDAARAWAERDATLERMARDYERFYTEVLNGTQRNVESARAPAAVGG